MNIERIDPASLAVGMDVVAHWKQPYGCGTGGTVTSVHPTTGFVVLESGTAKVINRIDLDDVHHWTQEVPYEAEECLDYHPDHCSGIVEDWWSGGMNGRNWPRCTFHGERRLERHEGSMERYADSDVEPSWFDSADIGERWGDDY